MLSREENDLLTSTGPERPLGVLMRRAWLPALLSRELPAPDGPPVRLQLLGERFVAFRDSTGRVGLLQEGCPHRLASLALGRNEDGGLRCVYHGWKYDVTGRCVDMPTERPGSRFADHIRAEAAAVREAGGIVWAYLGPPEHEPPFPAFPWLGLPATHCAVWKLLHECNYLQALERDVDFAHVRIAHRRLPEGAAADARLADIDRQDSAPRVEVERTRYGFRYATIYRPDEPTHQVRVAAFVLPCFLVLGPIDGHLVAMAFVPRDDESNWHFLVRYDPACPIDAATYAASRGLDNLDADGRKARNRDNAYRQDRAAMRTRTFNGIEGVIIEDHALAEIQGRRADRAREHLGATDAPVRALRALLLDAARAVVRGEPPLPWDEALPFDQIAGHTLTKPAAVPWQAVAPLPAALALAAEGDPSP